MTCNNDWTEIPDENIAFCDGLTEEQIKAYRLADNRTAEVATWNKTLLQHEIRSIKKLDMSRFKFEFKSKDRSFGAERLRTDKAYNLNLVSIFDCANGEMPELEVVDVVPDKLQGFNYAKATPDKDKAHKGCHFFIDDYQFERCWTDPKMMAERLRGYQCVFTPDFSLYMDMPYPMQRWNIYRSRAIGLIWQREGIKVVPTLSWSSPESYAFCFDGLPKGSTVAVSSVGVMDDERALDVWRNGMQEAIKRLKPMRILLYGKRPDFNFKDIEVIEYRNETTERMAYGR